MSESQPDQGVDASVPNRGSDASMPNQGVGVGVPDRSADASVPDMGTGSRAGDVDELLEEEPPELEIDLLEYDETIPPRPEEEVADVGRATPDPH